MPTRADLLNEMNGLMRLTAIEADVARSRATQARDESIRGELLDNARHADVRRLALHREVASLGGVPDILGVALDRIVTVARTQVLDQAMPITEALMADLVLEHQLRDRAAFARVIADSLEERRSVETLEKVEAAHVAAIEWIETRLGEVALGGPAALRPTPLQATAAVGQRVATMPSRVMVAGINRGIAVAERLGGRVGDRVGRAREVTEAAEGAFEEAFAAGRDTLLRTAESESESRGERRARRPRCTGSVPSRVRCPRRSSRSAGSRHSPRPRRSRGSSASTMPARCGPSAASRRSTRTAPACCAPRTDA